MAKTVKISDLAAHFVEICPNIASDEHTVKFLKDLGGMWAEAVVLGVEAFNATNLTTEDQKEIERLQKLIDQEEVKRAKKEEGIQSRNAVKMGKFDATTGATYITQVTNALNTMNEAIAKANAPFLEKIASYTQDKNALSGKKLDAGEAAFKAHLGDKGATNVKKDDDSIPFEKIWYSTFGKDSGMTIYRVETNQIAHKPEGSDEYVDLPNRKIANATNLQRFHKAGTSRASYTRKPEDVVKAFEEAVKLLDSCKNGKERHAIGLERTGGVSHTWNLTGNVRDRERQHDLVDFNRKEGVPAGMQEYVDELIKAAQKKNAEAANAEETD